MERFMLKHVRMAAGLRSPPNKWVNNVTDSLHNVMKEQINNNSVDLVHFLEKIKNKLFDQQMEELIRGIHGMGEYRLVESVSKYAISPVTWTAMTPDQRKSHVVKVLHVENVNNILSPVASHWFLPALFLCCYGWLGICSQATHTL